MMQRLLRGQLLYFVLGLLVIFLYMRAMRVASLRALEEAGSPQASQSVGVAPAEVEAAHVNDAMDWWPKTLDRAALKRAAAKEPLLGLALSALSIFVFGMGLSGVALTVSGVWTGRVRSIWRYHSRRLPRWSFGELGRITALILMLVSLLPLVRFSVAPQLSVKLGSHLWVSLSMLVLDSFVILIILVFASGKGKSVWRTLGFSGRQLAPSVGTAFRGYVAVFPWLFLLLFLTVEAVQYFGMKPPVEPIQELVFQEQNPLVLALTVLLACVVGPAGEELFFRGVLYPAIRQRSSRLTAMLISGAAFSLIHTNLVGFLPILVLGCLLADLYERTGSLISPLAVHMLHNTVLMSLAFVFRRLMWLIG